MGIYDREYARNEYDNQPGFYLSGPQSVTVKIIIFTAIVYVLQLVGGEPFTDLFANHAAWYKQPWRFFELLTAGFLHSPGDLRHILFNMLTLFFLGRAVEMRYGGREYLVVYLAAIVVSSLVWSLSTVVEAAGDLVGLGPTALGASGGVSAILLLYVLNFPKSKLAVYGILPLPAWLIGGLIMAYDLMGTLRRNPDDNVAYAAHLGGFLFAVIYFKSGIRLSNCLPNGFKLPSFGRSPSLRVHRPSVDKDAQMEARLDELLGKVGAGGQDSLSASEKRELNKLSKHFQQKRQ